MRDPVLKVPFPFGGVNENWGFDDQPNATCRDAQNMRSQDPTNRRMRGAKRPGQTKFVTGAVNGADKKVQDLGAIARSRLHVAYTARTATEDVTIDAETTVGPDFGADRPHVVRDMVTDRQGNVIVLHGTVRVDTSTTIAVSPGQMISVYSSDLVLIQELTIPLNSEEQGCLSLVMDPFGCLYTATCEDGDSVNDIVGGQLFKWERVPDSSDAGFQYELLWAIPSGFVAATSTTLDRVPDEGEGGTFRVWDVFYNETDDSLYTVQADGGTQRNNNAAIPSTARVLVYEGVGNVRPRLSHQFELDDTTDGVQLAPRSITVRNDGDIFVGHMASLWDVAPLQTTRITMWRRSGEFVDRVIVDRCGAGILLVSDDKTVITVGDTTISGNDGAAAVEATADGFGTPATLVSAARVPAFEVPATLIGGTIDHLRMVEDGLGKVYIPFSVSSSIGVTDSTLYVLAPPFTSATIAIEYVGKDAATLTPTNQAASPGAFCCAVPPRAPDYDGDLTGNDERAEFVYLGLTTDAQDTAGDTFGTFKTLRKIKMVETEHEAGGPRETRYLAVALGELKVLDPVGDTASAPAIVTPAGGPLLADSPTVLAPYVESVNLLSKRYYTDGRAYGVYDPFEDSWTKLTASRGELPRMCRLITAYRNRLVLARSAGGDGPHLWFMSRTGNPRDWDEEPVAESSADAISGTNLSGPLTCPDIITTLIPFDNDHLFFGCDRSIFLLRGDPRQGGELDNVTTEIGVAFGRPWCRDRRGGLWLIDSEGGLCMLTPNGIERASLDKLESRLRNVDQSTHYYRLVWDNESEGIHIYVMPFATTASADTEHYFYSARTHGFWPVKSGVGAGATAIAAFESDAPDDRTIAVGYADGIVRRYDRAADDDDGTGIDAFLDYGPWAPTQSGEEFRFQNLVVVLARDQGGCNFELFGLEDPDQPLGTSQAHGTLLPGRNRVTVSAQAAFIYLRLRDAGLTRFAVESVYFEGVEPTGRRTTR